MEGVNSADRAGHAEPQPEVLSTEVVIKGTEPEDSTPPKAGGK